MASTSTKITMTVPAPMLKAADRIAAAEYRTRAEVFREALREYIARKGRGGNLARRAGGRPLHDT
jgi:metal-responsive CopG/Arc/MetJ family transcriptional regulator